MSDPKGRARFSLRRRIPPASRARSRVVFSMPARLIVIGDLNGDATALTTILRAHNVIDDDLAFTARDTHVVQIGDVVNRGASARGALDLIMMWQTQALRRNSRFTMLLGNHEAMVALGNLAWCHAEEFLEFATPSERQHYERERGQQVYLQLDAKSRNGHTEPVTAAMKLWEMENVPGKTAYREAFGPEGPYGRFVRALPAAIRVGRVLLVHGGLTPRFASLGLPRLQGLVKSHWAKNPRCASDLDADSPLVSDDGPLWTRAFGLLQDAHAQSVAETALQRVRADLMVMGHTRTDLIGGVRGEPFIKGGGRLLFTDVGIGHSAGSLGCALIERGVVYGWHPARGRFRIDTLRPL